MMEIIKVANSRRIQATSEKAICVEIGRTFDGQVISTWYPKSVIRIKPTKSGYDVYAPAWVNYRRNCRIGSCDIPPVMSGMCPFPDDDERYDPYPSIKNY